MHQASLNCLRFPATSTDSRPSSPSKSRTGPARVWLRARRVRWDFFWRLPRVVCGMTWAPLCRGLTSLRIFHKLWFGGLRPWKKVKGGESVGIFYLKIFNRKNCVSIKISLIFQNFLRIKFLHFFKLENIKKWKKKQF